MGWVLGGSPEHHVEDGCGSGPLSGSQQTSSPRDANTEAATHVEQLEDDGFTVLRGVIPPDELLELRTQLCGELAHAIAHETRPPGDPDGTFAKINSREHRHDLRLRLEGRVGGAVKRVLSGRYADVYDAVLPEDAPLVELGTIASHPGADQQTIHSDVDFSPSSRRIYTTFCALQPITADMGPTMCWPGTHTDYFCSFYKPRMLGPVDPYYVDNPPQLMVLGEGDAVLMDTRVMHCGGKNSSDRDRYLFHFSFESTEEPDKPSGFTYNLMPHLRGKHTLGGLRASSPRPPSPGPSQPVTSRPP